MPYTLMKGLAWILLALLLGIVIGWALRHVVAKRQVARARNHHVDTAEMERLRGRIANLEPLVAERDRLRVELDAALATKPKSGMVPPPGERERLSATAATAATTGTAHGETATGRLTADPVPTGPAAATGESDVGEAPDVAAATAVLGRPIVADDLQVVEGVGPTIEDLCHGIGIRTWFDLATTEVSLLRTMLHDAGPRFRAHDPSSWPEQAHLLAEGRWVEFKAFTDALSGGRTAEPSAAE